MNRSDRQQLQQILAEVRQWASIASELGYLSWHRPVSGSQRLGPDLEPAVLALLEAARTDLDPAQRVTRSAVFTRRKSLTPALEAADRVRTLHRQLSEENASSRLAEALAEMRAADESERDQLGSALARLKESAGLARQALHDLLHMPLTRDGLLTAADQTLLESVDQLMSLHEQPAHAVWDRSLCAQNTCAEAHRSATLLASVDAEANESGAPERVRQQATDLRGRLRSEREELSKLRTQLQRWPARVAKIRSSRKQAATKSQKLVDELLEKGRKVSLDATDFQLIPLTRSHQDLVALLRLQRDHRLTDAQERELARAEEIANEFDQLSKIAFTKDWRCLENGRCHEAHRTIPAIHAAAAALQPQLDEIVTTVPSDLCSLDQLLDPTLEFTALLPNRIEPRSAQLIDQLLTASAITGAAAVADAAQVAKQASKTAKEAADTVRAADVASALKAMDLEVLKKASTESIRVGPLTTMGLENVWDVVQFGSKYILESVPGLGPSTAFSITQAAQRLLQGVREETPVRIDVKRRSKRTTALLEALQAWDAARRFEPTTVETKLAKALVQLFKTATPTHVLVVAEKPAQPLDVPDILKEALARAGQGDQAAEVWTDFLTRPADYFGMLTELGFLTEDEAKMHGDLPEEIVQAVRDKELNRQHLTASLRAYQSFGARFALVQRRVVIGDEMGLGKTVEALAVFAHLHATGQTHFLVVCPAAVVSNWLRETHKHTTLRAYRLHGPAWERQRAANSWQRYGGVAVITYDLLSSESYDLLTVDLAAAVFDEAHYIKNPMAKRSLASQTVIDEAGHAILMTGTPLENRVQEFRNLIGYLRPDLADSAPEYLPSKFRRHMAPAYLRRNQEDVLTELPELVEIDEWMGLSKTDEAEYRAAVAEGHFMKMRRAAMLSRDSMKMARLIELVREAEENDRRVIVFSYFRDVLDEVAAQLPGQVFGPLTGAVAAADRQRMVDRFSQASGGAVLVAQVTAGGVGLNIQAASVVVLCEPQVKPTMETQAIARAHRMGQVHTVQVHRLLTEGSVDERIRDILAEKRQLFDEFARDSVIADQAPDAVDVSDAELARVVIAAERERLFGGTAPQPVQ